MLKRTVLAAVAVAVAASAAVSCSGEPTIDDIGDAVEEGTPACADVFTPGAPPPELPYGCHKPDGVTATAGGWDCTGDLAGTKLRSAAGYWWYSDGTVNEGDIPSGEMDRCLG